MADHSIKPSDALRKAGGWTILLGILLLVLGVIAIAFPFASSLAAAIWVGWLLIIGGAVLLAHAIRGRHESGFWLKLLGRSSIWWPAYCCWPVRPPAF